MGWTIIHKHPQTAELQTFFLIFLAKLFSECDVDVWILN